MHLGLTGADYTCNFAIRFYTSVKLNCEAAADSGFRHLAFCAHPMGLISHSGAVQGRATPWSRRDRPDLFSGLRSDLEIAIGSVIVAASARIVHRHGRQRRRSPRMA